MREPELPASDDRERILCEATRAISMLHAASDVGATVDGALGVLGRALDVDRVYIFENTTHESSPLPLMSQRYEWTSHGTEPQLDSPELQELSYGDFFLRWHDELSAGREIAGLIRDFPREERPLLESQSIRSILVLPIHLDNYFWGFIGFDDCRSDRNWRPLESRLLQATAVAIGSLLRREAAEKQLQRHQENYQRATRAGSVGTWTWQVDTGAIALDPHLKEMLGYCDHEIENNLDDWGARVHPDDRALVEKAADDYLAGRSPEYRVEHRMLHRDGSIRWFEARGALVSDGTDHDRVIAGTDTDITERVKSRQHIERLAYYDQLTGLPNLSLLAQRATIAMAMASRQASGFAVLDLDLDGFRKINDSLGHGVGNKLLQQTSARLNRFLRDTDTLGRLSGDEFILLLPGVTESEVVGIANRIRAAVSEAFEIGAYRLNVTITIGVALRTSERLGFQDLMKNAGTALHRAKSKGSGLLEFYDPSMNASAIEMLTLDADLREALKNHDLQVYLQPKISLQTSRVTSAEALIRWRHPRRGFLSPAEFIPIAEQSNLIIDIGEYMLDAACEQLSQWKQEGLELMPLAVNLGARHFQATGFAQRIEARLAKYDISPDLLVLELTETTLLAEDPSVSAALAHLQSLGLGVSIDDFGTGYSSLQYLKRLPLTELKIDRSLVSKIGDREDRALVAAVIALGRSLQAHVVAEGVETEEQRDLLTSMGCSHAQGFLYSKALPPPDFVQWLHGHEATREPRAPMP